MRFLGNGFFWLAISIVHIRLIKCAASEFQLENGFTFKFQKNSLCLHVCSDQMNSFMSEVNLYWIKQQVT